MSFDIKATKYTTHLPVPKQPIHNKQPNCPLTEGANIHKTQNTKYLLHKIHVALINHMPQAKFNT